MLPPDKLCAVSEELSLLFTEVSSLNPPYWHFVKEPLTSKGSATDLREHQRSSFLGARLFRQESMLAIKLESPQITRTTDTTQILVFGQVRTGSDRYRHTQTPMND